MTGKRPSILLFAEGTTYNVYTLASLAKAFEELGWDTDVSPTILSEKGYIAYFQERKADVILEIDSYASPKRPTPKGSKHISWIMHPYVRPQSSRFWSMFYPGSDIQSDLVYYSLEPKALGYQTPIPENGGILLPGVDPDHFYPDENVRVERPVSFLGNIPRFISPNTSFVQSANGASVNAASFRNLLSFMMTHGEWIHGDFCWEKMKLLVDKLIQNWSGPGLHSQFLYHDQNKLFGIQVPKILNRYQIVKRSLVVSPKFEIFAEREWLQWPDFAPYYKGTAGSVAKRRTIFQSSRINIHSNIHGRNMHPHVLNCMAAGAPIAVLNSSRNKGPGGIAQYFTANEHYIPYSIGNMQQTLTSALRNQTKLAKMAKNAAAEVQKKHTWKHRAQQIINDLEKIQ